ncbi:MAG: A/G-specific adenine glycosylase [Candidatus Tyrphobacter sp.]
MRTLLQWHERHGRSDLPWRRRRSPYRTLVSEFMAQQTQVERVVPAFERFVRRFPSLHALARAPAGDVLRAWKGLGYNARAVRLSATARAIVERHGGRVPKATSALRELPGVGAYTAAAIRTFAYGLGDLPIDVNVGRVLHRLGRTKSAFSAGGYAIASALMDLGAAVCTARNPRCDECPLQEWCARRPLPRRRAPQKKRVPFERTARYARGRIVDRLRELQPGESIALRRLRADLAGVLPDASLRTLRALVHALAREGLVRAQGESVALP